MIYLNVMLTLFTYFMPNPIMTNVLEHLSHFEQSLDTNRIEDWVINHSTIKEQEIKELIELVPKASKIGTQQPMHISYGGISLKANGIFIKHYWRRCGNDTGPARKKARWSFTNTDMNALKITESLWKGTYKIIKWDKKQLILKKIKT